MVVSWTPVWLASSSSGGSTSDSLFLCWKKDWICPLCLSLSLFLWVRLVSCVFWDGSATSPFDSLPGQWAGWPVPPPSLSVSHGGVSVPSHPSHVRLWCNQLHRANSTPLGCSLTSIALWLSPSSTPQSSIIWWWATTRLRPFFFSHGLPHLSLPLKPQGLNGHWLRETTQTTRILTHKLLLTSTSFSYFLYHWVLLECQECSEHLWSRRLHMTECCY